MPHLCEEIRALFDNDDFVESVLNNSTFPFYYIVDLNYRIIYANEGFKELIAHGKDETGQSIFEVFPQLTKENSTFVKAAKTGKAIKDKYNSFIDMSGHRRFMQVNTCPLFKDGKIVAICEFGTDMTNVFFTNDQSKNDSKRLDCWQPYTMENIIGTSEAVSELKSEILMAASSKSNVLIYGETGTGKEMVAQAIYSASKAKSTEKFVAYNCAAIPETLLESILFGTVKGSFTGSMDKKGLFEYANGGVVFLDEINSMPMALQAKLLRVIQEKMVRRVGSNEEIPVDFRLITSTNVPLQEILDNKTLREDLFFRLNVLYIEVPPLRKRVEDIPLLVKHFINQLNPVTNKKIVGCHGEVLQILNDYDWPGNVRELRNIIERAMNVASESTLRPCDIKMQRFHTGKTVNPEKRGAEGSLNASLAALEKELIQGALIASDGVIAAAAKKLGIPPQTLNNKLIKYGFRDKTVRNDL